MDKKGKLLCPNCGFEPTENKKQCPNCGISVVKICPACSHKNIYECTTCAKCRTLLDPSSGKPISTADKARMFRTGAKTTRPAPSAANAKPASAAPSQAAPKPAAKPEDLKPKAAAPRPAQAKEELQPRAQAPSPKPAAKPEDLKPRASSRPPEQERAAAPKPKAEQHELSEAKKEELRAETIAKLERAAKTEKAAAPEASLPKAKPETKKPALEEVSFEELKPKAAEEEYSPKPVAKEEPVEEPMFSEDALPGSGADAAYEPKPVAKSRPEAKAEPKTDPALVQGYYDGEAELEPSNEEPASQEDTDIFEEYNDAVKASTERIQAEQEPAPAEYVPAPMPEVDHEHETETATIPEDEDLSTEYVASSSTFTEPLVPEEELAAAKEAPAPVAEPEPAKSAASKRLEKTASAGPLIDEEPAPQSMPEADEDKDNPFSPAFEESSGPSEQEPTPQEPEKPARHPGMDALPPQDPLSAMYENALKPVQRKPAAEQKSNPAMGIKGGAPEPKANDELANAYANAIGASTPKKETPATPAASAAPAMSATPGPAPVSAISAEKFIPAFSEDDTGPSEAPVQETVATTQNSIDDVSVQIDVAAGAVAVEKKPRRSLLKSPVFKVFIFLLIVAAGLYFGRPYISQFQADKAAAAFINSVASKNCNAAYGLLSSVSKAADPGFMETCADTSDGNVQYHSIMNIERGPDKGVWQYTRVKDNEPITRYVTMLREVEPKTLLAGDYKTQALNLLGWAKDGGWRAVYTDSLLKQMGKAIENKNYKEVLPFYNKIKELEPSNTDVDVYICLANYSSANYKEAITTCNTALQLAGNRQSVLSAAVVGYYIASSYYNLNQYDEVEKLTESASSVADKKTKCMLFELRVKALYSKGDSAGAAKTADSMANTCSGTEVEKQYKALHARGEEDAIAIAKPYRRLANQREMEDYVNTVAAVEAQANGYTDMPAVEWSAVYISSAIYNVKAVRQAFEFNQAQVLEKLYADLIVDVINNTAAIRNMIMPSDPVLKNAKMPEMPSAAAASAQTETKPAALVPDAAPQAAKTESTPAQETAPAPAQAPSAETVSDTQQPSASQQQAVAKTAPMVPSEQQNQQARQQQAAPPPLPDEENSLQEEEGEEEMNESEVPDLTIERF